MYTHTHIYIYMVVAFLKFEEISEPWNRFSPLIVLQLWVLHLERDTFLRTLPLETIGRCIEVMRLFQALDHIRWDTGTDCSGSLQ